MHSLGTIQAMNRKAVSGYVPRPVISIPEPSDHSEPFAESEGRRHFKELSIVISDAWLPNVVSPFMVPNKDIQSPRKIAEALRQLDSTIQTESLILSVKEILASLHDWLEVWKENDFRGTLNRDALFEFETVLGFRVRIYYAFMLEA